MMPDAHRPSSRRSSFSVAGDSSISSELSIERVNELRNDYITRHKEVSSMLFNTDANFSKKPSPIPSVQQSLHTTRNRQQSQPLPCLPPLTPPPKRTAFSEKKTVVGTPSCQVQDERENGASASGSISNFWDSILNSPRAFSSSIATTMDLSSLWGGESESRDLEEKKTSSDKLDDDKYMGDDDISTIATDDVYHYNSAEDQDDGIGFENFNNSICNSNDTNTTSRNLNGVSSENSRRFNDDLVIGNRSSSSGSGTGLSSGQVSSGQVTSGQVTTTNIPSSSASPVNVRNLIIHEFHSQDNLIQKFDSVHLSHDRTSSSNRLYKNSNQRTDLKEIFNDHSNNKNKNDNNNIGNDNTNGYNYGHYNNNNDNIDINDNCSNKNENNDSNDHEDNFKNSNETDRILHEKELLDFEELRKWRELELEADESFIKSLKQTKLDLIEKLQLLGDLES